MGLGFEASAGSIFAVNNFFVRLGVTGTSFLPIAICRHTRDGLSSACLLPRFTLSNSQTLLVLAKIMATVLLRLPDGSTVPLKIECCLLLYPYT